MRSDARVASPTSRKVVAVSVDLPDAADTAEAPEAADAALAVLQRRRGRSSGAGTVHIHRKCEE